MAALLATLMLPLHLGGGAGMAIGVGFAVAGVALGGASMALGAHHSLSRQARLLRYWALLGAMGFFVAGAALLSDVLDWPMVASEIVAILAVVGWWLVVGAHLLRTPSLQGARAFGVVTLVFAVAASLALLAQLLVEPAPGAVPARFAYVLWGPWGLLLALRLARARRPL